MSTPVSSTFCGDPSQGRPINLMGFMMDDILPRIRQLVSQLHAGHAATSSKILNNIGALLQAIMDIEQAMAGDYAMDETDIILLPGIDDDLIVL
jgi:hypothetical protein